ncbi:MAG: hypothetical protein KAR17_17065 [Cyclobacteriaceae bacterium]|nr:hypothetical protein [Cyclobacteriaceae bacterium]
MSFLTNIKSLWIIIIILVILNIASVGTIWLSKDHRPYSRSGTSSRSDRKIQQPRSVHFLTKELNFTADQQVKFDTLAASHKENLDLKTDEIRVLREQLVNRMKNQEFSSGSEELIKQIGQKQAEIELINFRNFRDVMNICDDKQKEKFIGMMQRAFKPRHDHGKRNR